MKGFGEEVVYLQLNQEESHLSQKAVQEIQIQIKKDREAGLLAPLPDEEGEESSESNDEEAITQDSEKKKKLKKPKKKKEPVIQPKPEESKPNPDNVEDDWA